MFVAEGQRGICYFYVLRTRSGTIRGITPPHKYRCFSKSLKLALRLLRSQRAFEPSTPTGCSNVPHSGMSSLISASRLHADRACDKLVTARTIGNELQSRCRACSTPFKAHKRPTPFLLERAHSPRRARATTCRNWTSQSFVKTCTCVNSQTGREGVRSEFPVGGFCCLLLFEVSLSPLWPRSS